MTITANNPSIKNAQKKTKNSLTARQALIMRYTSIGLWVLTFAAPFSVCLASFVVLLLANTAIYFSMDETQRKIFVAKIGDQQSRMNSGASAASCATGASSAGSTHPGAGAAAGHYVADEMKRRFK